MNLTLRVPAGSTITEVLGGNTGSAKPDANGFVSVDAGDALGLVAGGYRWPDLPVGSQVINDTNGLAPIRVNAFHWKNSDGSAVAAAASAGKFGYAITLGTSLALVGEAANNNTKTDIAITEVVLPPNYIAGQDITVTVNGQYAGAGTLTVKTVAVAAYRTADDGTEAASLVATAAQNLTNAAAETAFVVTGATLHPGDRLALKLTMVLTETAASATTGQVNSVRLS